jgi:hypothetical protein
VLPAFVVSLAVSGAAHAAKETVDPASFGDVVLFGFGGTLEIEATQTSSGVGAVDAVADVQESVGMVASLSDGSMKSAAEMQSVRAFQTVETGLEAAFGWNVMDLDAMVADPSYAAAWDTHTPAINKKMSGWGSGMAPTGVIYKDLATTLKQPDRDALMEAMGVQYVAVASLVISGEDQGVSIGGIGTSRVKPQTLTMITVYQRGEKKPVWRGSAQGKKTDEAITADFGQAAEGESEIILQSIQKSMEKLAEKYAAES